MNYIFSGPNYQYIIPGKPTPLNRPRFFNGHVYDSQKTQKFHHGLILKSQRVVDILDEPIHLDIIYVFKNTKKKRLTDYHHSKPDLDNLEKYVLDVGTGILWTDDCIISSVYHYKIYGDVAETIIRIKRL